MHLFCVSDIHSHFTPFKKALDEAGFKVNNPEHLLVCCGDYLDRGRESMEVIEFLSNLTNVVLVKGNHEVLMEAIWDRGCTLSHDMHNGSVQTIKDIFFKNSNVEPYEPNKVSEKVLKPFYSKMVNYFETKNYIFVHSFLPLAYDFGKEFSEVYKEDWREASDDEWEDAMWGNPFKLSKSGLNQTGKTLVFGHFHTSWPRAQYEGKAEFGEEADFSPYFGEDFIGLDACTAYSGKVNVLVLEDELLDEKE